MIKIKLFMPLIQWVEYSLMVQETGVQSQVESYQRLKKMVLDSAMFSTQYYKVSVKWSTTERREIRNFPYPSVFELTGHQRLTVKRGIRNVGQFPAAEVTNPGQNESQQMFAFCDRTDKEVGIGTYNSPNESADRVKEEERGYMIGQNPTA